jgi:hypothetical protein
VGQSPGVSPPILPSNKLSDQGVLAEDSPPITPDFRTPEKASSVLRKVISGKSLLSSSPVTSLSRGPASQVPSKVQSSQQSKRTVSSTSIGEQSPHCHPSTSRKPVFRLPPAPSKDPVRCPSAVQAEQATTKSLPQVNIPVAISRLLATSSKLHSPRFQFEVSPEAARFNFQLLVDHNFDLETLLNPVSGQCITSYGSEFKSPTALEPLLGHHPRWSAFRDRLENGATFPLVSLSEDVRIGDLQMACKRGNHKSATAHATFLAEAFSKETKKGWILLLPEEEAASIPHLEIAPLGVADQIGVSATGDFVSKLRVTHDLSFPGAISGESVNSRVEKDQLEPCMFGHTLLRVIHTIVHFRKKFPLKRIWLRKEDFKSAYRRLHLRAETALKSAVRLDMDGHPYILVSLRLPFGGAPCPSDFCVVSDVITDTINDLLACDEWDPSSISSQFLAKIPDEISLPDSLPFATARDLSVVLPDDYHGKADCFVDDIISCAVDDGDNLLRLKAAACTVIHAISHQASSDTHLPRQDIIADDKNEAEGAPEEVKICLGWQLDTRRLLVRLPYHKYKAWDSQILALRDRRTASDKDLRSILGRLENVAGINCMLGHFLNNIRSLQLKADRSGHNVKVTDQARKDLSLAQKFLHQAHLGFSMNLVTFRKPDIYYIGDASEHGLGGFATHGRAWRWEIPEDLRGRAHINLLEFITQVVCIWIDILEGAVSKHDCLLGLGDSTSAMGWLRRSNFREKQEGDTDWIAKQQVARQLAHLVIDSETVLYKQWFRGEDNVVADSLSRDLHFLSPSTHEKFLHLTVSPQLPDNFSIRPVPEEISCFIMSTLQLLPVKQQRLLPQKPSDLARGNIGILSSLASGSKSPLSSGVLTSSNKTSSCPPLPKLSEKVLSLHDLTNIWWREQSTPPSHMWHRPSGQTTGRTPDWTKMEGCASS